MSWTYSSSTSNLDRIRRLVGDTDTTDQQFSDEEINAELSITSNDIKQTAYNLLIGLATKLARRATSKSAGKYSESYANRIKDLKELATSILSAEGEPYDAIAEQTFGNPADPYAGPGENEFIDREGLRGGF